MFKVSCFQNDNVYFFQKQPLQLFVHHSAQKILGKQLPSHPSQTMLSTHLKRILQQLKTQFNILPELTFTKKRPSYAFAVAV